MPTMSVELTSIAVCPRIASRLYRTDSNRAQQGRSPDTLQIGIGSSRNPKILMPALGRLISLAVANHWRTFRVGEPPRSAANSQLLCAVRCTYTHLARNQIRTNQYVKLAVELPCAFSDTRLNRNVPHSDTAGSTVSQRFFSSFRTSCMRLITQTWDARGTPCLV